MFDFAKRCINLNLNGREVSVPFTVGDEQEEEEVQAVYCAEDVVVPPRQAYMIKGMVGCSAQSISATAHEVWLVEAQSEEQQSQLERRASAALDRLQELRQEAANVVKQRTRAAGRKSKREGHERRRQATGAEQWGGAGCRNAEEQEQEEYTQLLLKEVGTGTVEGLTHARWDADCNAAVIPVNGINLDDEPMVFRKGQRIAEATKLHADTVGIISDTAHCDDGTTTDGMSEETEHSEGDWRKGKSWKQLVQETRQEPHNAQFKEWRARKEAAIKIGEEEGQPGHVAQDIKECYLRLIFAYKEVISENPKKPGIIPGIYHQIIFNRPKDEVPPWREPYRRGSPAEEELKDEEVRMLIENDIVEKSQSPYCNQVVQVKKKDGSTRTCIDLRKCNLHTRFDAFPLARIDDSLDMLGKAKYMSTLDNSSAFWSIMLHPDSKPYTAFGTRGLGQFQFKRMCFGLKNATATYEEH